MVSIRSENWTRASPRTDISASRTGPFETLSKAGRGYVFSPDRTRNERAQRRQAEEERDARNKANGDGGPKEDGRRE